MVKEPHFQTITVKGKTTNVKAGCNNQVWKVKLTKILGHSNLKV